MNTNINFSFQNISSNRNELMGIGIIGVLINHLVLLSNAYGLPKTVLSSTWHLVYTEGFLLLSGFGLFWSLTKKNDIRQFLIRRIKRLLIPFILLSAPFFIIQMILKEETIWVYMLRQTSLGFWVFGNYSGMWYIAISMFLYLSFPICYKTLRLDNSKKTIIILLSYTIGWYILNVLLNKIIPDYYQMIKVGLVQVPAFYLGVLFGFLSYKNYDINRKNMLLMGVMYVISLWANHNISGLNSIVLLYEKVFFVCLLSGLLSSCNNYVLQAIKKLLRWFGKYTLELYIIHLLMYTFLHNDYFHLNLTSSNNIILSVLMALALCVPMHNEIDKTIKYLDILTTK